MVNIVYDQIILNFIKLYKSYELKRVDYGNASIFIFTTGIRLFSAIVSIDYKQDNAAKATFVMIEFKRFSYITTHSSSLNILFIILLYQPHKKQQNKGHS